MKRLVVCCDGTWQDLETDYPTNILKIAQSTEVSGADGTVQIVFYDPGVGTGDFGDRIGGGAFGHGIDEKILSAYQFIILNWQPGDELYLFGYSRGAYTVRSLGGLIRANGILKRRHIRKMPAAYAMYRDRQVGPDAPEAVQFRKDFSHPDDDVEITALCCFDTVGSLGVPDQIPLVPFDNWINAKYQFHDTTISHKIANAFHFLAIDERRKPFAPTLMEKSRNRPDQKLRQIWFVGDHSAIGGGAIRKAPLSNLTLVNMVAEIKKAGLGLTFDLSVIPDGFKSDVMAEFSVDSGVLAVLGGSEDRKIVGGFSALHPTVKVRWKGDRKYRPKSLKPFARQLDA